MASSDVNRAPIRCVTCDALLPAGATTCPICRVPIPAPAGGAAVARVCAHCAAMAAPGARRCPVCGTVFPPRASGEARRLTFHAEFRQVLTS